jgi:hypothetical protein
MIKCWSCCIPCCNNCFFASLLPSSVVDLACSWKYNLLTEKWMKNEWKMTCNQKSHTAAMDGAMLTEFCKLCLSTTTMVWVSQQEESKTMFCSDTQDRMFWGRSAELVRTSTHMNTYAKCRGANYMRQDWCKTDENKTSNGFHFLFSEKANWKMWWCNLKKLLFPQVRIKKNASCYHSWNVVNAEKTSNKFEIVNL